MDAENKEVDLYPLDSDGYAQAFSEVNDWAQIIAKYGVLVVPVLNENECNVTIKDLWSSFGPKITSDYKTWDTKNWPNPEHPFLSDQYVTTKQAFLTRTHPNVVKVFEFLYGTPR